MARENGAVILDAALALDHAGKQVAINAQHRRHTGQQRNDNVHRNTDVGAGKGLHPVRRDGINEGRRHTEHHRAQHAANGTLHGLFGADHRAELVLAERAACKVGAGIAAPGKAEDEQDEEDGVIAVLLHGQQLLEPDERVEAEDHNARKHRKAAGFLVADGRRCAPPDRWHRTAPPGRRRASPDARQTLVARQHDRAMCMAPEPPSSGQSCFSKPRAA